MDVIRWVYSPAPFSTGGVPSLFIHTRLSWRCFEMMTIAPNVCEVSASIVLRAKRGCNTGHEDWPSFGSKCHTLVELTQISSTRDCFVTWSAPDGSLHVHAPFRYAFGCALEAW